MPTSGGNALGARLRTLREGASLSGNALAAALGAGWRQPKISKIETGRQLPSTDEIAAWAEATGAEIEPLLALRAKASAEYTAHRDGIADAGGAVALQEEVAALASSSSVVAEYQTAMVPGLLQTPSYMREMAIGDRTLAEDGIPPSEIGHLIAARVRRQAILHEPGREIIHIVGEAALRTRIGGMSIATLRAQLAHLIAVAESKERPGHTFGVLPFSSPMPFAPLSGWSMYDRDLVVIETLDGNVQITEPEVIARYSDWFEQMLAVAHTGAQAAQFCQQVAASLDDQ